MKTTLIILSLFISCCLSVRANNPDHYTSYFQHLTEINKEWLKYKEICPAGNGAFTNDADRIQLHLNLIIKHLKTNYDSKLSTKQLSNRMNLLEKLQHYADKKIFPINTQHETRQPYFVDAFGTNCAVGQMIYVSGHKQLVAEISKTHNFDYIQDIHTQGLKEWAMEFGFTLDELKWIQPSYAPSTVINQVEKGTNGKVKKILNNPYENSLIIAGEFTELDSLPCLNIGTFKNSQLSCLGSGIDGIVNDVFMKGNLIYACGELIYNGQTYPIAKFDGTNWTYISIPNRDNAVCTAGNESNFAYEVAVSHSSIPGSQEVWEFSNPNVWTKKCRLNGMVYEIMSGCKVYAGHFDSVMVFNYYPGVDSTIMVNNVVMNNYYEPWHGLGSSISDTVKTAVFIGGAYIFGGTCSNQQGNSNVCISRYFNYTMQPLFINDDATEDYSINSIKYKAGDDSFIFGGDFNQNFSDMIYGKNLAEYDLVSNGILGLAVLDEPVYDLAFSYNELFLGGSFQNNLGSEINFLGKTIISTSGTEELEFKEDVIVYPNPFTSSINLIGVEEGAVYTLKNVDGREVKSGILTDGKINELDFLPNGTYILQVETKSGIVVRKLIK